MNALPMDQILNIFHGVLVSILHLIYFSHTRIRHEEISSVESKEGRNIINSTEDHRGK